MPTDFRTLLDALREADVLIDINKPVDIRHIATLVDKSDKALLFHQVMGYEMPVLSGLTNSRERIALAMGCAYAECESRIRRSLDEQIEPVVVERGSITVAFRVAIRIRVKTCRESIAIFRRVSIRPVCH